MLRQPGGDSIVPPSSGNDQLSHTTPEQPPAPVKTPSLPLMEPLSSVHIDRAVSHALLEERTRRAIRMKELQAQLNHVSALDIHSQQQQLENQLQVSG